MSVLVQGKSEVKKVYCLEAVVSCVSYIIVFIICRYDDSELFTTLMFSSVKHSHWRPSVFCLRMLMGNGSALHLCSDYPKLGNFSGGATFFFFKSAFLIS